MVVIKPYITHILVYCLINFLRELPYSPIVLKDFWNRRRAKVSKNLWFNILDKMDKNFWFNSLSPGFSCTYLIKSYNWSEAHTSTNVTCFMLVTLFKNQVEMVIFLRDNRIWIQKSRKSFPFLKNKSYNFLTPRDRSELILWNTATF